MKVLTSLSMKIDEHNKEQHTVDAIIVLGQPQGQEEQPHAEPQHGDTPALRREAV